MSSASDLMFGGAAPAAKFASVGDKITGVIVNEEGRQRNKYDPDKPGCQGGPLWWKNGKPVEMDHAVAESMRLRPVEDPVLTLALFESDADGNLSIKTDPEVDGDDGQRRLFVSSQVMFQAIKAAVIGAGGKRGFELGAVLSVEFTGMAKPKKKGARAPKDYKATYALPTPESLKLLATVAGGDDGAELADPDDPWS